MRLSILLTFCEFGISMCCLKRNELRKLGPQVLASPCHAPLSTGGAAAADAGRGGCVLFRQRAWQLQLVAQLGMSASTSRLFAAGCFAAFLRWSFGPFSLPRLLCLCSSDWLGFCCFQSARDALLPRCSRLFVTSVFVPGVSGGNGAARRAVRPRAQLQLAGGTFLSRCLLIGIGVRCDLTGSWTAHCVLSLTGLAADCVVWLDISLRWFRRLFCVAASQGYILGRTLVAALERSEAFDQKSLLDSVRCCLLAACASCLNCEILAVLWF